MGLTSWFTCYTPNIISLCIVTPAVLYAAHQCTNDKKSCKFVRFIYSVVAVAVLFSFLYDVYYGVVVEILLTQIIYVSFVSGLLFYAAYNGKSASHSHHNIIKI